MFSSHLIQNFCVYKIGTLDGTSLPLIFVFKNCTNGIKKESSCSRYQREEQGNICRKLWHFGHHNSKQGKNSLCCAFHPSINFAEEQEHPRHKPVITLSLLKAPVEESPRRYFESLTSDADSSSSCPVAMQVMTTGTTSIEE
ncbi:hypothetical protein ACFX10_013282 [Malus domestica]